MIPEVSVEELAAKLKTADQFILLDVRETWELALAKIPDKRLVAGPMSGLANKGLDGLPEPALQKDAEIYVLCHHGVRSANVTGWLAAQVVACSPFREGGPCGVQRPNVSAPSVASQT